MKDLINMKICDNMFVWLTW